MIEREDRDFEFALFPILRTQSAVDYFNDMTGDQGAVSQWTNQTFHPRNRKYVVDVVGYLADGSVLHIEQETLASKDMPLRMLEYATAILIDCELTRKLRQILFYTGDSAKRWGHPTGPVDGTFIANNQRGYLSFKYLIVDAGQPDPLRIAETDFPAAALGLLARSRPVASEVALILAERIANLEQPHRRDALVACSNVLRLGRWRAIFEAALMEVGVNEPLADGVLPDDLTYDQARQMAVYAGGYDTALELLGACSIEPRSRSMGMSHGSDG